MEPTHTTAGTDARQTASGMTREGIRAFIERRRQAFNNADAAGLAADYAADAVVESPMAGTHTGAHAVERALQALFDAFTDLEMRTEDVLIDGNSVVHVVGVEGNQTGEFMGLPPSGKPFSLSVVFFYELKDGKILRERRIYDFTGLLVQIGLLKARPA